MATDSRFTGCLIALGMSLVLWGCASQSLRPSAGNAALTRADYERLIVVAVDNPPAFAQPHAGSTSRDYDGGGGYASNPLAQQALAGLARDYGLERRAEWPIEELRMDCAVFSIAPSAERAAVLRKLQQDRRVTLAQPLQTYKTQAEAAAPYAELQTAMLQMAVPDAHRYARGRGIRVAVIDTGIDSTHPALKGRVLREENYVDDDPVRFHADRHGTAVGGIIAADAAGPRGMVGVAPEAQLLALKACWEVRAGSDAAECNTFTLAKALATAISARSDIINLSLTGPDDPLLRALTRRAISHGIVVVGPAPRAADTAFPGGIADVLRVSSSESSTPDSSALRAPGSEVLTLAPGGRFDFVSGDSIATAAITGVAALLKSEQRTLTAADLQRLMSRATLVRTAARGATNVVDACQALVQIARATYCPAR
jgi:subtilisin family serine protease